MNPNKVLWGGDFGEIAAFMRQSGEEVVQQFLDLAKSENESEGGGISIPATFLRVTVRV